MHFELIKGDAFAGIHDGCQAAIFGLGLGAALCSWFPGDSDCSPEFRKHEGIDKEEWPDLQQYTCE